MKKILSVFAVFALLFSILSVPASAEGFTYDFDYNSQSILMMSLDNGEIVYTMNPDERRPMASITKIMTFIVAYESIEDIENTYITVSEKVEDELEGTGSSLAGIYVGEELTGYELLNLMMIPSGNDAALTLAIYCDEHKDKVEAYRNSKYGTGSDDTSDVEESDEDVYTDDVPDPVKAAETAVNAVAGAEDDSESSEDEDSEESDEDEEESTGAVSEYSKYFVSLMNEKAKELGCNDTHFVNPHGLYDPDHYSTARDIATIVQYATKLPYFTDITSCTAYKLRATNMCEEERTVSTTNQMMSMYSSDGMYYYMYCNGIKTGSLNEAGYCIAASATYEGYTYVVVALGCPMIDEYGNELDYHGEMVDAATLFRWAFLNLSMKNIAEAGDLIGEVKLNYAWNQDTLQVVAGTNVSAILPDDVEISSIVCTVNLPEDVDAPVKKGDVIGTAVYSYAGEDITTVNLVASESVEKSDIIKTIETGQSVVTSPWFLIIVGLIILVVAAYIIIILSYNKRKKRMRKIKRYKDM